ncbi:MAG: addiction module protein [Acidobacteria bacterium]|nr:addiction module protein [Acidobacteriota bacterium]
MSPTRLEDLLNLSAGTRADLAMALWESLDDTQKAEELTLTQAQREELERRLAEHEAAPETAVPWEEVRRRLKSGD